MFDKPTERRLLLKAAASIAALMVLPAWAEPLPTVDEIAFDPAIPALGNPNGDVTIVEFVDYQCPYCKLCYREVMKLIAEDGNIRLVLKDWPIFGDDSRFAARMALAAAGGLRYADAVTALMDNERRLSARRTSAVLSKAGFDPATLRDDLGLRLAEIDLTLTRNDAQAMSFKLPGTPALLVGGLLYKRGMPLAELKKTVATVRAARPV